jgi:hypothetical protein
MTIGLWTLLATVAYGGVFFFLFSCLRAASAADEASDRSLLAMLSERRGPMSARGGHGHRQETGRMPLRLPLRGFIALTKAGRRFAARL